MGSAGRIALLIAFMLSVAAADYYSDGCNEVMCYEVGPSVVYPNPRDECSFCACSHDYQLGKHAEYIPCPGLTYDPTLKKCRPCYPCKHPQKTLTYIQIELCMGVTCPPCFEGNLPNPSDPCSYCQCTGNGPEKINCPPGEGYDVATHTCRPNAMCV